MSLGFGCLWFKVSGFRFCSPLELLELRESDFGFGV